MGIYDTASRYAAAVPGWLDEFDAKRLAAYAFYEGLWLNDDSVYAITLRQDEENPIFLPSPKRIVRTMARYTCRKLGFAAYREGKEILATDAADAIMAFGNLFTREEFFANFRDALEQGIALGDFALQIWADPFKPEGSRIGLKFLDPAMVFWRFAPDDPDRIVGVSLIEEVIEGTDPYLKVQRWLKPTDPDHPSYDEEAPDYEAAITYDATLYEIQDFKDPTKRKVFRTIESQIEVPGITTLPIYGFKNRGKTMEPYGISELQGFERLFLGINQGITDEDVALAMQGLGMYVSNVKPVNEAGERVDWVLGPRRVVEVSGPKNEAYFERVSGVADVKASQDHLNLLVDFAESTSGVSDVALGQVDTSMAESGIALAIRMGPTIDEAERKNDRLLSKLRQVFFDLKTWFSIYESQTFDELITIEPVVGPMLPVDVDKALARLQDLFVNGVIPTRLYIEKLNELGLDLGDPLALIAESQKEAADRMAAQQEALGGTETGFNDRLGEEAGDEDAA